MTAHRPLLPLLVALGLAGAPAALAGPVGRPRCANAYADQHMTTAPVVLHLSCSDPQGLPLRVTVGAPARGTLSSITPEGQGRFTVVYEPARLQRGQDWFPYTASNGARSSAPAMLLVAMEDEAPACANSLARTTRGRPVAVSVRCTDPDGDPLRLAVMIPPTPREGTASGPDAQGRITFTPAPDFWGQAAFRFKGTDAGGLSDGAMVYVQVTNRHPQCQAPPVQVLRRHGSARVALSCTDADGDALTLHTGVLPWAGNLSPYSGTGPSFAVTYTPGFGYTGRDSFTVVPNDGVDDGPPVTVRLQVVAPGGSDPAPPTLPVASAGPG